MRYIIIGNGVAGTTAAASIRKIDSSGDIIICTDEGVPFYSRIRLPEYLAGETDEKGLIIHRNEWYEEKGVRLLLNTPISEIDKERQEVVTLRGERMVYDRLLLASGGYSFTPPIPGSDKKGVFTLRSMKDARGIVEYVTGRKKVLLIGGGVLGLEAGHGLRKRGCDITVAEFFPRLLPRQMDTEGADILKSQLEGMGFSFFLGARSKEITGDGKAESLLLEDGTRIDCDMIILSAGVRPHAELAVKLGLKINKGLVVNDRMETGIGGIYAAGDLIEHRGAFYGIWPAAERQGEVAGVNMAGGNEIYEGTVMSNVLKVAGIDLAAAGDIDADGKQESVIYRDRETFIYRKLVITDNVLSGCIMYGDISGFRRVLKAIDAKRDVGDIMSSLRKWDLNVL